MRQLLNLLLLYFILISVLPVENAWERRISPQGLIKYEINYISVLLCNCDCWMSSDSAVLYCTPCVRPVLSFHFHPSLSWWTHQMYHEYRFWKIAVLIWTRWLGWSCFNTRNVPSLYPQCCKHNTLMCSETASTHTHQKVHTYLIMQSLKGSMSEHAGRRLLKLWWYDARKHTMCAQTHKGIHSTHTQLCTRWHTVCTYTRCKLNCGDMIHAHRHTHTHTHR